MPRAVKAQPKPKPSPSPEPEPTGPRRKSLPLPPGVILEICTHAHPLDVLFLARTCKTLRSVLRERSSSSAWKQAFRNAALPKCPDDIAGPHYAAMFYESVCDGCGSSRCKKGRRDVHWDVRRRLCVKCTRKLLVGVPKKCPGLPDGQLADLVPTSGIAGSIGKAYEPMLRKIMDEIRTVAADNAPGLPAHVGELKRKLSVIELHSREAEQWNEDEAKKLIEKEDFTIRQASVCSRLQNEGWGEQLDIYRAYVLGHELVNQAKQLFDDDWELYRERIKDDAVAKWSAKHESRLLKQRKRERYRRWVLALGDLNRLEKTFDDGGVWPDGNDLRRMPELQAMLNGVEVSADAVVKGEPADSAAAIGSLACDRTQSLADGDLAIGASPPTAASADYTPGDQPDSAVTAGNSSESVVGSEDDTEDEEGDDDNYYQDDTYGEETRSDSDESILPPGHDPDSLTYSLDTDSDADEEAMGDSLSKMQEKAAISAAMDRLFPSALIAWRHSISLRLFNSIPSKIVCSIAGDVETSTDDAKIAFLSRAATVFECRGSDELSDTWLSCCGDHYGLPASWDFEGRLVFYPEALRHRDACAIENLDRMEHLESRTDYATFDSQQQLRVAWSPDSLEISKAGSVFMKKLVQASGLDHRTATQREMDEADARFVCKTCLDASEPNGEKALKVHNWLSCLHDNFSMHEDFSDGSHCGGQHPARFIRVTNPGAEARTRELAPRGDNFQPLSVAFAELGFPRETLLG